jgi:hypothetical protein
MVKPDLIKLWPYRTERHLVYSWHKCRCDLCVSAKRERDRQYYKRNSEARKAKVREYRAANLQNVKDADRRYREANVDRIRQQRREYNKTHAAENRARVEAWRRANPTKRKALAVLTTDVVDTSVVRQ